MTFSCADCGREFGTKQGLGVHRNATHEAEDKPYTDAETLREMYWGRGMSMRQIADELGTDHDRVDYWMDVHDIETRTGYAEQPHASLTIDKDGYPLWKTYVDGYHARVRVHRLLAVAEYGFDAVVGNDVHHKNGVRWDNRPENIEPMDPSEHRRHHGLERADEQRELMTKLREAGRLNGGEA